MAIILKRRSFLQRSSALLVGAQMQSLWRPAWAADMDVIAETSYGKVRGALVEGISVFKGIPYGDTTAGKNRFMPPVKPAKWTGVRDALEFGHSAPQVAANPRPGSPALGEDCLMLNVYTPALSGKRPVMMWLHGGGFATGSGSGNGYNGVSHAHNHDIVMVTINHRLNVFGQTFLGEAAGADFSPSAAVGLLDIVSALEWVRDNIERFGGDPNQVTIFGQSGGGRKVATLMAMPSAKGLFHRAIIESGAVLRLVEKNEAIEQTNLLLRELGLNQSRARELQTVPMDKLLAANAAVQAKLKLKEPGEVANSPMVDGKVIPVHPWDPAGPALSANVPLIIGWNRTEETDFDQPTPEKMAMTEDVMRERVAKRLESDPEPVITAFRKIFPDTTPWDVYILIASNHPRGAYAQELAKRKAAQRAAPVWVYRFDFDTPERGGHMHSPHGVEIPFAFNNLKTAGPLISKMPGAIALEEEVATAWATFARTGNPNHAKLPNWPVYSAAKRDTMMFNSECRVVSDPQNVARVAMEKVLKLG